MTHEQTILGQCPSKSNQYRIITIGGHASLKKSDAVKKYEESFYLQCGKYRNRNIKSFFEFYIDVYFQSNRSDLDNACKVTLDMLQSCKAICNDRQCVKIVANKFIDKNSPRIEFTIVEVGGVESCDSNTPSLF